MDARLITNTAASGSWNMAVDEALLESAARQGVPCLRFYQWHPATVSLGYFQSHRDRLQHAASLHAPWLRRPTGGGAIVHDRELTYSLVVPDTFRLPPEQWYRQVHEALLAVLRQAGVAARIEWNAPARSGPPSFLCFLRRGRFDLFVGQHKMLGSAQRRRRGALLQHGSFLLARSVLAPEVPGLADIAPGVSTDVQTWIAGWSSILEERLGWRFYPDEISDMEKQKAADLCELRYDSPLWNLRR
ncbi:MAG: lipoate--protein ligase [Pirellulaceae bacterium]|nr:MAG: lipoate--protein ligase [Pirellulaceae bacterium]